MRSKLLLFLGAFLSVVATIGITSYAATRLERERCLKPEPKNETEEISTHVYLVKE